MYYVALGDLEIPKVTKISPGRDREIKDYEGVGSGTFSVPGSRNPREWIIECTITNASVFTALENQMNSNEATRLVINSKAEKTSVLVLLESYQKPEEYAGIYQVSLKLKEYIPVGIKTTNVPYVKRPGKVPVTPKAASIKRKLSNNKGGTRTGGKSANLAGRLTLAECAIFEKSFEDDPTRNNPTGTVLTIDAFSSKAVSEAKYNAAKFRLDCLQHQIDIGWDIAGGLKNTAEWKSCQATIDLYNKQAKLRANGTDDPWARLNDNEETSYSYWYEISKGK